MHDNQFVFNRLADGREVKTSICNCGHCGNEFYVPALSDEWTPNYCPFCGIKFVRQDFNGEPVEYQNRYANPAAVRRLVEAAEAYVKAQKAAVFDTCTKPGELLERAKVALELFDTLAAAVADVKGGE